MAPNIPPRTFDDESRPQETTALLRSLSTAENGMNMQHQRETDEELSDSRMPLKSALGTGESPKSKDSSWSGCPNGGFFYQRLNWTKFGLFFLVIVVGTALLLLPNGEETEENGGGFSPPMPPPLSTLDPVKDLNVLFLDRSDDTSPPNFIVRDHHFVPPPTTHSTGGGDDTPDASQTSALPTNQWYENMILSDGEPTSLQRVYAIPYVIDVVGPVPGLRLHPTHADATQTVMQMSYVETNGLTIGTMLEDRSDDTDLSHQYEILSTTPLGITLRWNQTGMASSVVRGMPYATMHYSLTPKLPVVPVIVSEIDLKASPIVDGNSTLKCSPGGELGDSTHVHRELMLHFLQSDFTWLVFFSETVLVHCVQDSGKTIIRFKTVEEPKFHEDDQDLIVRVALANNCTTGANPLYCTVRNVANNDRDVQEFAELLREHAPVFPGFETSVRYAFVEPEQANLVLDWDARVFPNWQRFVDEELMLPSQSPPELLAYGLPHHMDILTHLPDKCVPTLLGPSCLIVGSVWQLDEPLPSLSFRAPRPPKAEYFSTLAAVVADDMNFSIPDYFVRGAGDTYFSGKMMAKMGRIIVIADELIEICSDDQSYDGAYKAVCEQVTLPAKSDILEVVASLKAATEVWINGNAEAPFVYDTKWGGLISCGCLFEDGTCLNTFPDCPSFTNPGLNFGNGFYNDHHFHYGYHIFSAAVVAHYDPAWGREFFDQVMLLVRDIANPSLADRFFPLFRHKDWYQGHSWASGIVHPAYLNGRNQESSSEAIAAYEAVGLYGAVMAEAWEGINPELSQAAEHAGNIGKLLTATELRSADRYWHVRLKEHKKKIYPEAYGENVVGIMWNTMAQFQTWFGNAPYLTYGIQLLPVTPIAEQRDDIEWLREMYPKLANACNSDKHCEEGGWSVQQLTVLASVGYPDFALNRTLKLSNDVFLGAGGNGHSRSNTVWFIATRPDVEPTRLPASDTRIQDEEVEEMVDGNMTRSFVLRHCGEPDTCKKAVLDSDADGYTCAERIDYLVDIMEYTEYEACARVGGVEYPSICGDCNPSLEAPEEEEDKSCPPCSEEQCSSELNRCPVYRRSYVCTEGRSRGGCTNTPWDVDQPQCQACCELTHCKKPDATKLSAKKLDPATCPLCPKDICETTKAQCPILGAPYLCTSGNAKLGCSPEPWDLGSGDCLECCMMKEVCH